MFLQLELFFFTGSQFYIRGVSNLILQDLLFCEMFDHARSGCGRRKCSKYGFPIHKHTGFRSLMEGLKSRL